MVRVADAKEVRCRSFCAYLPLRSLALLDGVSSPSWRSWLSRIPKNRWTHFPVDFRSTNSSGVAVHRWHCGGNILRHRLAPFRRASAWPRWCGSTSRVPMSVSWGLWPSVPCHFWGPLLWLGRPCGEGADTFRETAALFLARNSTRRGGLTMFVERGRPEGAGHRQSDAIAPKLASALDAAAPANGCDADQ